MAVDFLSPVRLMRKKWTDASELAQELYAMAVSREARQTGAPLEIVAPAGAQPALRIRRQQPGEPAPFPAQAAPGRAIVAGEPYRPNPSVKVDYIEQARQTPPSVPTRVRGGDQVSAVLGALLGISPAAGPDVQAPAQLPAVLPPLDRFLDAARASAQPRNLFVPPVSPGGQVTSQAARPSRTATPPPEAPGPLSSPPTLDTVPVNGDKRKQPVPLVAAPPLPLTATTLPQTGFAQTTSARGVDQFSRPHVNPVVEVEGPVSFRGKEPVQFDTPPLVWSPGTGTYEPTLDVNDRNQFADTFWGQNISRVCKIGDTDIPAAVSGGAATPIQPSSGLAYIYDWNNRSLVDMGAGGSPETVYNYSDSSIPKNTWNLVINNQGDWFVIVGGGSGSFAMTDGGAIPAMVGAVPGSGTVTLYTLTGGTLTAGTTSVTAYNIGSQPVGASKFVTLAKVGGVWVVDVEPCP